MDIENIFKDIINIKKNRYLSPPQFPYAVYIDDEKTRTFNGVYIKEHEITIELYSDTIRDDLESKIENRLSKYNIDFEKNRDWIGTEKMFQTNFDFLILEKGGF